MKPDKCENCGISTDDLEDIKKPDGSGVNWFICEKCKLELYNPVPIMENR